MGFCAFCIDSASLSIMVIDHLGLVDSVFHLKFTPKFVCTHVAAVLLRPSTLTRAGDVIAAKTAFSSAEAPATY